MSSRAPFLIALVLGAGSGAFVPWLSSLEVMNLDTLKKLVVPLGPGRAFFLEYTHSIYGSQVREHFQLRGSKIILLGVQTSQGAVAEYYGFDGSSQALEAKGEFSTLVFMVRMSPGDQVIQGAKRIDLRDMGRPGDRILLRPIRSSPLSLLFSNG